MAYLAPCLARLRTEVNQKWPGRDRTSDGWIGDTSHQARPSDHNPDPPVIGVVRALDIDIDGISELDVIAAMLRNPATNYVIYNGRISQRVNGFAWRTYTGPNPHRGHVHCSIRRGYERDATPWLYGSGGTTVTNPIGGGGKVPTGPNVTVPKPIAPIVPDPEETDMIVFEYEDEVWLRDGLSFRRLTDASQIAVAKATANKVIRVDAIGITAARQLVESTITDTRQNLGL